MAKKTSEEALIRDFLAKRIDQLPSMVENLSRVRRELEAEDDRFKALPSNDGGPGPLDLLRRILAKRNLRGLESFHALELLGVEFQLLQTGKPGFQPSADILARCTADSRLFLIEVKQLMLTEREAVTELSAYSHGLHQRFWNITTTDQVWIPICTEWRTTVRAAFANEAISNQRCVLPMSCTIKKNTKGTITKVPLKLFSLLDTIDEPTALAQFAWDCFDTITFELSKEPSDVRTLVEFISTTAARYGFSGCVLYGESAAGTAFPYPYVYAVAIHNPFKAALKAHQLRIVLEDNTGHGGPEAMRKLVKEDLWTCFDLDLSSMQMRETPDILHEIANQLEAAGKHREARRMRREAKKSYISVQEIAQASRSRSSALHAEIKNRLQLFCKFENGAPSLQGLLRQSVPVVFDHISYFGLMQEAVYERLYWEVLHAKGGDGPIIGDYGGDPVFAIGSPSFFFDFMELMNFEHGAQDT